MGKGERPELQAPPEIYYDEEEAHKYTQNSRIMNIQVQLTRRAVELLALPPGPTEGGTPCLLLDLGCGSGLSAEQLSDMGHVWVGMDISAAMLDVAQDRECEGDLLLGDLGHGLPLRAGMFDGAISISAVQWLCNADRSSHDPRKRLRRFFETLYASLSRGARAVLQIYPENPAQAEMIVGAAMRAGFSGGLVIDFPHSAKAKKYYLVLMVGTTSYLPQARGLNGEEPDEEGEETGEIKVAARQRKKVHAKGAKKGDTKPEKGSRGWILQKKDSMRKRGYEDIPTDTKYTGRKRRNKM